MQELEKAREVFLRDVDEETYAENKQMLTDWEQNLRRNQTYEKWRSHPTTEELNKMVREAYRDFSLVLAERRNLTDEQRYSLWAKQDACLFILGLTSRDAKSEIESILLDIRKALTVTS
jgi:hypothetical protein